MRGFGQKATLVLINGRRTSNYGFAQNLQDSFVDLNSIPTSAVERIEILLDGASAIYGSDAIAGVVNIILRNDYRGAEVSGGAGWYEGKREYRASLTVGMGDPGVDKFNLFGVFDYYKRDHLILAESEFGKSRDYRGETGGRNLQSLTAGGVWTGVPGAANANERRAATECPQWGTVVNAQQAIGLGLLNPAAATNLPQNTWCLVDINKDISALPGTEREGFLGRATYNISSTTQLWGEVGLSRVETHSSTTPPFFAGSTGTTVTPAGLRPFTYNITFAPGVAGNPLPANARFTGNLFAIGDRTNDITSDTARLVTGLKWSLLGFDADSAIGWARNKVEADSKNAALLSATSRVFGVTASRQPPVPVSTSSVCNLDRPSTTLAACASTTGEVPRISKSELSFADTKINGELPLQLPGGPVGFATGVEYRREKLQDMPAFSLANGDVLGLGATATDGRRNSTAGYVEFALPVTRQLELQAAGRYDHYSDFGSAAVPKWGFKFKPMNSLIIRGTWGRGFRAPSLPEISPSSATFFTQVNDPVTGQTGVQISGNNSGNPNLKPEKSISQTFGVVFEPSPDFNIGVNYFDLSWNNIVTSPSFQQTVDDCANRGIGCENVIRDPTNNNTVVTVNTGYINLNNVFVRGWDMDVKYSLPTSFGRFTARGNGTYIDSFQTDGFEGAGRNDGFYVTPRFKGKLSLDYGNGPFVVTTAMNYVHHYWQGRAPASAFNPTTFGQNGTYPERIPRYKTYDIFGKYTITKNLSMSGSIVNFTNHLPPFDTYRSSTFNYDYTVYDIRGRQFRLGLTYKL